MRLERTINPHSFRCLEYILYTSSFLESGTRTRHRLGLDELEDVHELLLQLLLHDAERDVVAERGNVVLQLLQLLEVLAGEEVRSRRQGLSRLCARATKCRGEIWGRGVELRMALYYMRVESEG